MIGTVVGSYKIVDRIGEGGMGSVFKGIDLMLEREVAIKVLRPELARRADIVERFRTEAVALARLNHPNIATLFNFFRQGDDYFMVMEFVRGETLDELMWKHGPLPADFALRVFCQALEGIDHAHKMGIIHRDIKPANIMVTPAGLTKVMDFGIARMLGTARLTMHGGVVGTAEYMSPEQVQGLETDARSDIYSLGIMLYEMLTGRAPFSGKSEYESMRLHIESAPLPPTALVPNIPAYIENGITRALAKNPNDRFQTAADFREALLAGVPLPARPLGRGAEVFPVGPPRQPVPGLMRPASHDQPPPTEVRVPPPGQTWPGPYGNQLANPAAPVQIAPPNPGIAPASSFRPSDGVGPNSNPLAGRPQASMEYWQSQMAMTAAQHRARQPLLSRLTWKHYLGALVALVILLAVPFVMLAVLVNQAAPPSDSAGAAPSPAGKPSDQSAFAPQTAISPGNASRATQPSPSPIQSPPRQSSVSGPEPASSPGAADPAAKKSAAERQQAARRAAELEAAEKARRRAAAERALDQ
jgi:hypothetical protein